MTHLEARIRALSPDQRDALKRAMASRAAAAPAGLARQPLALSRLSPPQMRLWLMAQLDGASSAYNIPGVFRLDGALDIGALQQALAAVQARHESLRSVFANDADGAPEQRVLAACTPDFALLDPPEANEAHDHDAGSAAMPVVRGVLLQSFELAAAPPWRARLLPLGPDAHLLILSFHHLVFDGWSLGVFANELFALYGGAALPAPRHQYSDYAAWRARPAELQSRKAEADYWRGALAGELPLLDLPADRARPQTPSYRGAIHKAVLPRALFDGVVALAAQTGATPYAAFLSVFKILLYRYTGKHDQIVGTPVAGRTHPDLAPLIGVFVNTLPIRSYLDPARPFVDLLQQVKSASLDAFAHQELPFDGIVEARNPPRVSGFHPIFQVLYTYQNALAPIAAGPLAVSYLDVDCGSAKFDLSLDVYQTADGANCIFEYSTDLFSAERIARMAGHYVQLLADVLGAPGTPVGALPMLSWTELALVRRGLEAGRHAPPCADVVSLIAARSQQYPHAVAVRDGALSLSYAELDAHANRIAHALLAGGVARGDVVGICMERSARLIASVLGVLKAGAAFVAMDASHPPARLAALAQDAGLAWIVKDHGANAALAQCTGCTLDLDQDAALIAAASAAAPALAIGAGDPAYVVYTSGTTGKPKGVVLTHGNWMNAFVGWQHAYRLQRRRAHLQMAGFAFDVFCGDFIRALGSGRTLVICPSPVLGAPEALLALLRHTECDVAEFVPAVFRSLAEYLGESGQRLDFMKIVIVASDAWYAAEYRAYAAVLGKDTRLINSYGMAEAGIDSTWFEGSLDGVADGSLVPIGAPFPNVDVWILDANLQALPPGVPGEICVGGAGVARGYLNRPQLSAEKFVPHPFSTEPGALLYRSGDFGRLRADGAIELLGRADTQVKIRGMRIELGEIEMCLHQHAGVAQCAAVVRQDRAGNARIVVFLAQPMEAEAAPDLAALNAQLARHLPAYMLPGAYVVLARLPLSANGKVDRAALPQDDGGVAAADQGFVSPRTLNEEMLATIWIQMFNLARVGVHDSFFHLGGHSLLAFQLVARIRESFRVDLALGVLFLNPTIAGLARAISELQGTSASYDATIDALPLVVADPGARHLPFALTEVQQAYWLGRNEVFEFGNVTTHSYDEMGTTHIDPARFQRAWNQVVARHDMLRAEILHDGTQRILATVPEYQVAVLDLRGASEAQCAAGIDSVRAEMGHQMLDVHRWPVFDVRITLLPQDQARIHFSNDALIFDVWSFVIIIEDLVRYYLDQAAALPVLTLSFRDYVIAEDKIRLTPRYRRALDYWRERVAELPPAPDLPMVMDPALLKKPHFTRLHQSFDRETWARLKKKAVRAGLTTTGLMLAAYAEVLAAWSSEPAFSLNLTFLNRHPLHPQVNDIVGEFTSLTLLSVDQRRGQSFAERARQVQADLWNDLEHHDISGVQVLRDLTRAHGGATRAKMPVVFTSALVVPIPKRNSAFPIVPIYRDGVTQTSQVWLDCGVWEDDQVLLCNWDVVLELYPQGLIEAMFDAYCALTRRLADDDAAWDGQQSPLVAALPLAAPMQPAPAPTDLAPATLDSLFFDTLARTPHAIAVAAPGLSMTYRKLAQHVAWVSAKLSGATLSAANAVQRGELVAVVMHKGWEQAAATLGILHAGAAYMPVDPALPAQRIAELLADGGVRSLLTTPALAPVLAPTLAALAVPVRILALDSMGVADPALLNPSRARPQDIAYVMFTSGSSGKPKGVMIAHRGAVNTIVDVNRTLEIGAADRMLSLSSLSFDLSVYDLFGAFAAGATLVLPQNERRLDPSHWAELIAGFGVTVWNSVPALCGLLADYCETSGIKAGAAGATQVDTLRHVMLSGDWLPVKLPGRVRALFPQAQVLSLGGATEASIWSVWYPIKEVDPAWTSIPYGKAMHRQGIHVLDHRLEAAPPWVTGDIYLSGVGLALGYWRAPDLSARAFITHPRTGERLYRTGDLGRLMHDGNVEFLGRRDQQVKLQGMRIELGEIEAALLRHGAVRAAAVTCRGERHAEKRLAAYYCLQPGMQATAAELRSFLLSQLPEYMVPHALAPLPALPLSANGKVDRKRLPDIDAGPAADSVHVDARDSAEAGIATLWADLLGIDRVSVTADFFKLGGDSMIAIKLLVVLRRHFACNLELKHVFQHPTVASQATLIATLGGQTTLTLPHSLNKEPA